MQEWVQNVQSWDLICGFRIYGSRPLTIYDLEMCLGYSHVLEPGNSYHEEFGMSALLCAGVANLYMSWTALIIL